MAGDSEATWGTESTQQTKAFMNDEFVDWEGWEKGPFVQRYGFDPEKIGLPACNRVHPVSGASIPIYWAPKEGPLFTLRMTTQDSAKWSSEMMGRQVYASQGIETAEHIRSQFEAQHAWRDILLSQTHFQSLALRGNPSSAAVVSPSKTWTPMMGASGPVRPVGSQAAVRPPAFRGHMKPPQQLKLGVAATTATVNKTAGSARVVVSAVGPTAAKRGPSLSSVLAADAPAQKVARSVQSQPFPTTHSAIAKSRSSRDGKSHLTMNPMNTRVPLSMPGVVPSASDAQSSIGGGGDGASEAGVVVGGVAFSKDKFERVVQKASLPNAFAAMDMTQAIINLKKMASQAKSQMSISISDNILEHMDKTTSAVGLVWSPGLLGSTWEVCRKHVMLLKEKEVIIPPSNWMYYSGRKALESVEPRNPSMDISGFTTCLPLTLEACEEEGRTRQSYDNPSLANSNIPISLYKESAAGVVTQVIVEGVFVSTLQRGSMYLVTFQKQLTMVKTYIDNTPEFFRSQLEGLLVKVRGLSLMFGQLPFEHGSTIKDASLLLDDKKDCLTAMIVQKDFWGKQQIDGVWSRSASESVVWPTMEPTMEELKKKEESSMDAAQLALDKFNNWRLGVRASTIQLLQSILTDYLTSMIALQDFGATATDDLDVNGTKPRLLKMNRQALSLFQSPVLAQTLSNASNFAARMTTMTMQKSVLDAAHHLNEQGASSSISLEMVGDFQKSLPSDNGIRLILSEPSSVKCITEAIGTLIETVVQCGAVEAAPLVQTAFDTVQKIQVTQTSENDVDYQEWTERTKAVHVLQTVMTLKQHFEAYTAIGDTALARVSADKSLKAIKQLIKSGSELPAVWPEAISKNDALTKQFDELADNTKTSIRAHGDLFLANALPKLQAKVAALGPSAKGGCEGGSWKEHLAQDCSKAELLSTAASTLMQLNHSNFIDLIRGLSQDRIHDVSLNVL